MSIIVGPDFLGRSPVQPGFTAAAGFAAFYFRQNGLAPAGTENSYFQRYTMIEVRVLPETAAMESADGALRFEFAKDYTFRAPADFETKARFAFVRLAKGAKLSGLDLNSLKGKIVVISPDSNIVNRQAVSKLIALPPANLQALLVISPIKTGTPIGAALPAQRVKDISLENENKFTFLRIALGAMITYMYDGFHLR